MNNPPPPLLFICHCGRTFKIIMCLLTLQKRGGQGKENVSLDENVNIWDISCDQSLASFDWAGHLLLQYKLLKYRHTMWRNICNWAQQWQSSGHMTDLCMHEVLACSISLQYLPAVFACIICIQPIPNCICRSEVYIPLKLLQANNV